MKCLPMGFISPIALNVQQFFNVTNPMEVRFYFFLLMVRRIDEFLEQGLSIQIGCLVLRVDLIHKLIVNAPSTD